MRDGKRHAVASLSVTGVTVRKSIKEASCASLSHSTTPSHFANLRGFREHLQKYKPFGFHASHSTQEGAYPFHRTHSLGLLMQPPLIVPLPRPKILYKTLLTAMQFTLITFYK